MRAADLPRGPLIGFRYLGVLYIRLIPSKNLFRSTLVHEVVNRMDVFAVDVATQQFTVIKGTAEVEPVRITITDVDDFHKPTKPPASVKALAERLKQQDLEL